MNISGLVGALLPVFFVLALGYFAGKRNAFDPDQAAGLSKLATSYALPASLFVSMTDIPKESASATGTSLPGSDSRSCWSLSRSLGSSGTCEKSARDPRDPLRTCAGDIRDPGFWIGRSRANPW